MPFALKSPFSPTGDQPQAIEKLTQGLKKTRHHQVLLGVTGSGKTFTVANVIQNCQRPTLVISHNKTLAAQLYQEFKEFFPKNKVEYFVSYYDYYQPESYLPQTDTYIEKETDINEEIDKLRLSATTSLLTHQDVIIVASVSCIYNLGSPIEYAAHIIELKQGMPLDRDDLILRLHDLHYERSDYDFRRATYRVRGDTVEIYLAYAEEALRVTFLSDRVSQLVRTDPLTGERLEDTKEGEYKSPHQTYSIYPAKHYLTAEARRQKALSQIEADLYQQLTCLKEKGKNLEAYRLEQRTNYDLEMMRELGYCNGIENYSRYFDGRSPGDAPFTLLDFFSTPSKEGNQANSPSRSEIAAFRPRDGGSKASAHSGSEQDWLCIIDESHMTVPQIRGMYNGDRSRKETLVDFGFRLPSCLDNRPLRFDEFLRRVPQIIYTSATPGDWELSMSRSEALQALHPSGVSKYDNGYTTNKTRLHPKGVNYSGTKIMPRIESGGVVEQLIRPTGLIDPQIIVQPTQGQVDHLKQEIAKRVALQQRVLVTTLTKRMAEELADYLKEQGFKVTYLHSDVETLKRTDILRDLRLGQYDVLVGINLLREGLDLPEVSLVAILDADKEGFLRSETSLIQVMGRAARHLQGQVIMYADQITGSMKRAIDEVNRRRQVQLNYNLRHSIKPQTIIKPIRESLVKPGEEQAPQKEKRLAKSLVQSREEFRLLAAKEQKAVLKELRARMLSAAELLEFEEAAKYRDLLREFTKVK